MRFVEIQPATIAQVVAGKDGKYVEIPGDVGQVVVDLQRIDPTFRVRWSITGEHYVIYQHIDEPDGRVTHHFCFTALQLDQRIVERALKITHPDYDIGHELERGTLQGRETRRKRMREQIEGHAEQLAWAARKDLGVKDRIAL